MEPRNHGKYTEFAFHPQDDDPMATPRDRLYVNLGASQTRKRLKGHGFGVKKVETAGKGRAVIVHTATGRHRRQLHALFADVLDHDSASDEDDDATPLTSDF